MTSGRVLPLQTISPSTVCDRRHTHSDLDLLESLSYPASHQLPPNGRAQGKTSCVRLSTLSTFPDLGIEGQGINLRGD